MLYSYKKMCHTDNETRANYIPCMESHLGHPQKMLFARENSRLTKWQLTIYSFSTDVVLYDTCISPKLNFHVYPLNIND